MIINFKEEGSYYVASIDGNDCKTWNDFLKEIGVALKFPSYYGQNIHAFRDCMNDLSWMEKRNIILFINNSEQLLENGDQFDDREYIMNEFEKITQNWISGSNAESEVENTKALKFNVIYN